jgi:hypothetical protein
MMMAGQQAWEDAKNSKDIDDRQDDGGFNVVFWWWLALIRSIGQGGWVQVDWSDQLSLYRGCLEALISIQASLMRKSSKGYTHDHET